MTIINEDYISMPTRNIVTQQAAIEAGNHALQYFRQHSIIDYKHDNSPVTRADKESELLARNLISRHFVDDSIIGEEHNNIIKKSDYSWIIDPIDGTRSFISGNPLWGSLVTCMHHNIPMFGACYMPYNNDLLYNDADNVIWYNSQIVRPNKRHINVADSTIHSTCPTMFDADKLQQLQSLIKAVRGIRYGGDCFLYVALIMGWIDIVIEAELKIYDIAPFIPMIHHIGGVITDWQGNPLKDDISVHNIQQNYAIIATRNPDIHHDVMEHLC